jgi:thiamine biosynthesis lipoprotein
MTTTFEAIGTHWQIDLGSQDVARIETCLQAVAGLIEDFDKTFSRFRADSLVTRIAQQAGTFELGVHARALLSLYAEMYELTDGAMTPMVGQVLSDAGYDATYSLKEKALTVAESWPSTVTVIGSTITTHNPVLLDFGAAGKGYLVDLIARIITSHGFTDYTVNAGGDIAHGGQTPLRVGLEHPGDPTSIIGTAELSGRSLCGSATNRRRWGRFHHVIDPRSLTSPENISAIWVIADTALLADGLTTALFFTGAEKLETKFNFEYVILDHAHRAKISAHWPGALFYDAPINS